MDFDSLVGPLDVWGRREDFFELLGRECPLFDSSRSVVRGGDSVPCRIGRCDRDEVGDLEFDLELASMTLSTFA